MQISWTGVTIVAIGLGAVVALVLFGQDDGGAIATAILAGILGLLAPHPVRRAPKSAESGEEE